MFIIFLMLSLTPHVCFWRNLMLACVMVLLKLLSVSNYKLHLRNFITYIPLKHILISLCTSCEEVKDENEKEERLWEFGSESAAGKGSGPPDAASTPQHSSVLTLLAPSQSYVDSVETLPPRSLLQLSPSSSLPRCVRNRGRERVDGIKKTCYLI